jgi:hypothetical protein
MQEATKSPSAVRTDIPFRLDRLPWSRFHLLVVVGLGITWILDGLEVTIVGSLGPALQSAQTLSLSSANLGAFASFSQQPYSLRFIEPCAAIGQHFLAPWRKLKKVTVQLDVATIHQTQYLAPLFVIKRRCLANIAQNGNLCVGEHRTSTCYQDLSRLTVPVGASSSS